MEVPVDVTLLEEGHLVGADDEEEEVEEGGQREDHQPHHNGAEDSLPAPVDVSVSGVSLDGKSGDVASWLITLNLGNLVPRFYAQGYDDLDVIKALDDKDLDALGIDKPGIRKKLLLYARKLQQDPARIAPPITAIPKLPPAVLATQKLVPPSPQKKARSPYRCSKCCMFKVQSINKHNSHKCDEKLIGHTWENCPTHNIRAHPEEQENRRKKRAEERKKKKEEKKKQRVERKRKQDQQKEHPFVAIDWDTFRQEELRRIIEANPERYSKDMEGQRLMEAMLIIIARYNDLKMMVEQMKNKKRKFTSTMESITPLTMQDVIETNSRLTLNSLQPLSPSQMQQLEQLQQSETLEQHQHKLQQLHQLQLQHLQRQKDPLQPQQTALQQQRLQQQQSPQNLLRQQQQLLQQQHMLQAQQGQQAHLLHGVLQPAHSPTED